MRFVSIESQQRRGDDDGKKDVGDEELEREEGHAISSIPVGLKLENSIENKRRLQASD